MHWYFYNEIKQFVSNLLKAVGKNDNCFSKKEIVEASNCLELHDESKAWKIIIIIDKSQQEARENQEL